MYSIKINMNYFAIIPLLSGMLAFLNPMQSYAFEPLTCPLNIHNFNNSNTVSFTEKENLVIDKALEERGYTRDVSSKSDVVLYFRSYKKELAPYFLKYSMSAVLNFKSIPEALDEDPQYCPILGSSESSIYRTTRIYNRSLSNHKINLAVEAVEDLPPCVQIINTINMRLKNAENNSSVSCIQQFHDASKSNKLLNLIQKQHTRQK